MARARDIFDRLVSGGDVALATLIAERDLESLFLDFKRSPQDGASQNLAAEDNKNLSKAISGFANSSGGVVVWGVDCRRDVNGVETATKWPLLDAAGFASKLQGAISRATLPQHSTVEVAHFPAADEVAKGFVAVFIPQSTSGPMRSVATNHYHLRSGSDFGVVTHDVLAGMFGRAPQPKIDANFVSYPASLATLGFFVLRLDLVAVNLGAVVCERPFLSAQFGDFPPEHIAVKAGSDAFALRRGQLSAFSVISNADLILAPGAAESLCCLQVEVPVAHPRGITIDFMIGCFHAPPKRFRLQADVDAMRGGMDKTAEGRLQSSEVLRLDPHQ